MKPPFRAALGVALFLFQCAAQALAAAYDDFNAGVAQYTRQNWAGAVIALTRALETGDLTPSLVPVAYFDRGVAHMRLKEIDLGLSDLASAIAAKPDYVEAFKVRSELNAEQGRLAEANSDLDVAIGLKPDRHDLYRARGILRWERGKFEEAAADFAQTTKINPLDFFATIWQVIAGSRTTPIDRSALRRTVNHFDLRQWPGPIAKLFDGDMSPDEVKHAAARSAIPARLYPLCDTDFYIAEWHVLRNELAEARPLFEAALNDCPEDVSERRAAQIELARITFP
jgi:lipoprotein NlpI